MTELTNGKPVMNFSLLVEYSENGIVSKRILQQGNGNITLFSFDRDQKLSEHTAPFNALIQIIEGRAEISISGVKYSVNEGESIILPAGKPHAVYAAEKFKMLLTMIKES
jgi:quercetin dioxygenase-like cupin family protein